MAYQDIKAGKVVTTSPAGADPNLLQLWNEHTQLAQEVRECHKRIQHFTSTITGGATSSAITLAIPTFTTSYIVVVEFPFTNGGEWITAKTKTGFTLNWVTASPIGTNTFRFLVVE